MKWKLLIASLFLFFLFSSASALEQPENEVTVYFFYSIGCPYCAKMEPFIDNLAEEHAPFVKIEKYDVKKDTQLVLEKGEAYGLDFGDTITVPIVLVDEKAFAGHSAETETEVREEIERCLAEECISPAEKKAKGRDSKIALTIPAVLIAAAVDAINPCALMVLILLLTAILAAGNRRRALFAGLAYAASIFVSYYLMGLGLYSAIQATGVTQAIYIGVSILAIIVGLFNLKDYLWYGKWFVVEIPLSWRPKLKRIVRGITSVPGAFGVGFLVSLFLLPCTSGPYIVILGLLSHVATRTTALLYLVLYNFVFVLPMIIITLAIYSGFTTAEKAEKWRKDKIKKLHLIAGVFLLLLGIGMLLAVGFGII